jgi:2-hydroxychromene-2-carboxylate isomerase
MHHPDSIAFYFDFLSPYSYLAMERLHHDGTLLDRILPIPIILGTILGKRKVLGPGEDPVRRRIALDDILMLADLYRVPLVGPPRHPFNSVYALRLATSVVDDPKRCLSLSRELFQRAWANGDNLEDLPLLDGVARSHGIAACVEDIATQPEVRARLKSNTLDALERGVYGVPTMVFNDSLFFGQDRIPLLKSLVLGEIQRDPQRLAQLLERTGMTRIL